MPDLKIEPTAFPEDIPSGKLSNLFQDTTTSYKFYWFWSILDLLKTRQGESVFTFDEIIAGMVEKVWYPVVYFRLFFGSQDRLSEVVLKIQQGGNLPDNSKDISSKVLQYYQANQRQFKTTVDSFKKYVPFRLLSPWHKSEDHNQIVVDAAKNFQNHQNLPLYRFLTANGTVAQKASEAIAIEMQPRWKGFLLQNQILYDRKAGKGISIPAEIQE